MRFRWTILLASILLLLAACRSEHVEITVENHTGAPAQLLEVNYPSASFGVNALAAGGAYSYQVQLRNSGPVTVQYVRPDGKRIQNMGPVLAEHQDGRLAIDLLPGDKANFRPEFASTP